DRVGTKERVRDALPQVVHDVPKSCVTLRTLVAKDRSFAIVTPVYSAAAGCRRYVTAGFYLVERYWARGTTTSKFSDGTWEVIYHGSDPPPCSLGVPRS